MGAFCLIIKVLVLIIKVFRMNMLSLLLSAYSSSQMIIIVTELNLIFLSSLL